GTLTPINPNLTIAHHQLPEINWDPGFDDNGVPILYALNSYFTFNLTDGIDTDNLEIRISADNLIVVDDDHLRIIGNTAAAPGSHLPALDGLGGRAMTLADLNGQNLTLGSTGVASILPITWLSYQAEELPYGNLVSWSTAQEERNKEFAILKSMDAINFEDIGQVSGKGYSNEVQAYQFLDQSINLSRKIYYQINHLDFDGNQNLSPIFQLILKSASEVQIYPNPYENQQQPVVISIPDILREKPSRI